ncbi:hypothetical protein OIU78_006215 [Salix suchowensis]|nr:hypothetical protein OIU78_006215 [Salix suchowensis]
MEAMLRPVINLLLLAEGNHLVGLNLQRPKEEMKVVSRLIHGVIKHQQVLGETKGMVKIAKEGGNCFAEVAM